MFMNKTVISVIAIPSVLALSTMSVPATKALADDGFISIREGSVYDASGNKMVSGKNSYNYASGSPVCPIATVVLKDGKTIYKKDADFLIYYFKNRKSGTATAVLRGNHKRGYKDAIILKYKIVKKSQQMNSGDSGSGSQGGSASSGSGSSTSEGGSSASGGSSSNLLDLSQATAGGIPEQTYTGKALTPAVSLYYNGKKILAKNYTLSYADNTAIGTATVTATGTGSIFKGSKSVSFNIVAAKGTFKVGTIAAQKYIGSAITPKPCVSAGNTVLKEGVDYTLSYANNTAVGTATVAIKGMGAYVGYTTKVVAFKIIEKSQQESSGSGSSGSSGTSANSTSIASAKVTMASRFYTTSLSAVTPSPTVKMGTKTLKAGTDYTLSYKNNKNPGTATMTITGKGAYKGTKSVSFTLVNMGDDMALTACKLAYPTAHYYSGGKYPGTAKYLAAFKKAGSSQAWVKGRSCDAGVFTAVKTAGYDKSFPSTCAKQSKYLGYTKKSCPAARWTYVGKYNGNVSKSGLRPGDVLYASTSSGCHIIMYTGSTIAKKAHKNASGNWVSAHYGGGLGKPHNAALCICNGSWSLANSSYYKGKWKIYRCTKPSNSNYRAGAVVK